MHGCSVQNDIIDSFVRYGVCFKTGQLRGFSRENLCTRTNLRFNGISVRPAISIIDENHSNIITENKMIFDQDNGRPNSNCN